MVGRGPLAVATVVAAAVGAAGCGAAAPPEEAATTIRVAAGVSLTAVFTELVEEFEAENPGVRVRLEPGRSVELARAMRGRTDLHLFAATGRSAMGIALADGSARDPRTFARNYMVLAVPSGNPAGVTRLADLGRPELRVGLCIEDGACGQSSGELLTAAAVAPDVDERVPDSQTLTRRLGGDEFDAGLVFRTDVAASRGWVEEVDGDDHDRLLERDVGATDYLLAEVPGGLQDGVDDAAERAAVAAFRDLVASDRGRAALEDAGFEFLERTNE